MPVHDAGDPGLHDIKRICEATRIKVDMLLEDQNLERALRKIVDFIGKGQEVSAQVEREIRERYKPLLVPAPDRGVLFKDRWLTPVTAPVYLIDGWVPRSDFGNKLIHGGPEKALKSGLDMAFHISIGSEWPLFGMFASGPPAYNFSFLGEGGETWNQQRYLRACEGAGVSPTEVAEYFQAWTVPMTPRELALELPAVLEDHPVLTTVDSLYAFTGGVRRQLEEMGPLLTQMAGQCQMAGSTLSILDHFRKDEYNLRLASLSGTGASQWAHAWVLQRSDYDPDHDRAVLTVKVGSRMAADRHYRIEVRGVNEGPMTFTCERVPSPSETASTRPAKEAPTFADKVGRLLLTQRGKGWATKREVARGFHLDELDLDALVGGATGGVDGVFGCESVSGKKQWMCVVGKDEEVPPLPRYAAHLGWAHLLDLFDEGLFDEGDDQGEDD